MATQNNKYFENEHGVHMANPNESEHMLCGDAWDGDITETAHGKFGDFSEMQPTKKRIVTCTRCIAVIESCRGVRTKQATNGTN